MNNIFLVRKYEKISINIIIWLINKKIEKFYYFINRKIDEILKSKGLDIMSYIVITVLYASNSTIKLVWI